MHQFLEKTLADLVVATAAEESEFEQSVTTLKSGPHSYAGLYIPPEEAEGIFVKCYSPKGWLGSQASRMGLARAQRAFKCAKAIDRSLPVSVPAGLVANRFSNNIYYFSNLVPGRDLSTLYKGSQLVPAELERVMSIVGRKLGEFHNGGWQHGDFKWGNIMLQPDWSVGEGKVCFIDLDDVSAVRGLGRSSARDLARFIVNGEDYGIEEPVLRLFVEAYAAAVRKDVREVLRKSAPALAKLRFRHDRKYGKRPTTAFDQEIG